MNLVSKILIVLFVLSIKVSGQNKSMPIPDYYGEHITYDLKVGFFQIGEVDINFRGDSTACDAYITSKARSTGLVNFIKDVHYEFDACVDTSLGYTLQSKRKIKEGSFYDYDEVYYDRTSRPDSTIVTTEDNDTLLVPPGIYDILFAFFQFRKSYISPTMKEGTVFTLHTFFVDKEWDLIIEYAGKEQIKTDLGTTTCYKFLPKTEVGEYFQTEEDMVIWITANRHRIPVLIEVKMKVATFTAQITSYTKVAQ